MHLHVWTLSCPICPPSRRKVTLNLPRPQCAHSARDRGQPATIANILEGEESSANFTLSLGCSDSRARVLIGSAFALVCGGPGRWIKGVTRIPFGFWRLKEQTKGVGSGHTVSSGVNKPDNGHDTRSGELLGQFFVISVIVFLSFTAQKNDLQLRESWEWHGAEINYWRWYGSCNVFFLKRNLLWLWTDVGRWGIAFDWHHLALMKLKILSLWVCFMRWQVPLCIVLA